MRQLIILAACALTGCAHTLETPPARCSELVPTDWRTGVEAVPLPGFEEVGEVLTAFIAQTGQLEKANGRTKDSIHIVENCERLINAARPRDKFLGVF